ncbi:MAG TPA: hypothetical protein VHX44_05755 [Planctomycetota bacterium]|nr:hypothetical protein [Planctomycetota bacterium]
MTPLSHLLTGDVLDRHKQKLGVMRRIVLLVAAGGSLRLLRGLGEAHVCDLKLRASYWLHIRKVGEVRVRVMSIEHYANKRCLVHFKILIGGAVHCG